MSNNRYAGNNTVQLRRPQKSQFDLSHYRRMSMKAGYLTPCFITECVPSDKFNGSSEIMVRLAPLLAPIYDTLELFVHFFFVPNRLLWVDWEKFITGGRLGEDVPPDSPVPPFWSIATGLQDLDMFDKGRLGDYLGITPLKDLPGYTNPSSYAGKRCDALPFLAYSRVFYDYYRDRNFLSDEIMAFPYASGAMDTGDPVDYRTTFLQTRYYEHDYFTSALPFTQRGSDVLIPMAGQGSVTYLATSQVYDSSGDDPTSSGSLSVAIGDSNLRIPPGSPGIQARIENIDDVSFENSTASINDFRTAYALQVWFERNAIAGSRYNESTEAHFGVKPQDSRLQRPEYIGGGRMPIKISEIVSTAYSSDGEATIPLANLAGHGITYGNTNRFNYFCTEHGFIIGIASIMSCPSYHQGIPRMFNRSTFLDYPWPTFARLGEQQIDKAELFASPANLESNGDGVRPAFGYTSRYADWKQIMSSNHGDFHDDLLFWTCTRNFATSPVLGTEFLSFNRADVDRIFAVQDSEVDKFWCYVNNKVYVSRPLPYFGTPNTLGFV